MKQSKYKNKKTIIVAAFSFLFLFFIFSFLFVVAREAGRKEFVAEKQKDAVDVEILEENEALDERAENELEEAVEADMEDLEVREGTEEVIEVDSEAGGQAEGEALVLPLLQRNKKPNELRIGFMTDIHAKSNSGASRSQRIIKPFFKDCINYFIEEMNNEFLPDFLLLNGDVIEGTGRDSEIGSGELISIRKLFDRTLIPKYWVVGNHDLRAVDKGLWKQSLGIDYLTKSFDVRDYRIIIMDSNFTKEDEDVEPEKYFTRGKVSQEQLEWLKGELSTGKRKIVFIHHPPLWSVDVRSDSGLPFNALELQEVFRENNVTAVFAGHIEDFYYDKIDGVKYFVLPGVVKSEKYQGTFAEITIIDDEVELNVSYLGGNGKYRKINIKEIVE